jgi:hypothetical protein
LVFLIIFFLLSSFTFSSGQFRESASLGEALEFPQVKFSY